MRTGHEPLLLEYLNSKSLIRINMRHNHVFDSSDFIYSPGTSLILIKYPVVVEFFDSFVIIIYEFKINVWICTRNFQVKAPFPIQLIYLYLVSIIRFGFTLAINLDINLALIEFQPHRLSRCTINDLGLLATDVAN